MGHPPPSEPFSRLHRHIDDRYARLVGSPESQPRPAAPLDRELLAGLAPAGFRPRFRLRPTPWQRTIAAYGVLPTLGAPDPWLGFWLRAGRPDSSRPPVTRRMVTWRSRHE